MACKIDRGRSWVVAACCCFCNLIFYGVSRLSGIMLVAATHAFQVSRARAAMPFSLSTAIRNLAGVFVGHLGHRFGVGPVVAVGCLVASLGSGLCFFAQDIQWITICWGGLFGAGFGLSTCLLPLAINQHFAKHNGTASGISYSGAYIGSFIFPPVIVWLLESYGFQGTFLIISGGVLHVSAAAIFLGTGKDGQKDEAAAIEGENGGKKNNNSYRRSDSVSYIDVESCGFCNNNYNEFEKDMEKNSSKSFTNSNISEINSRRLSLALYTPLSNIANNCSSNPSVENQRNSAIFQIQSNDTLHTLAASVVQNCSESSFAKVVDSCPMIFVPRLGSSASLRPLESADRLIYDERVLLKYNRINSYHGLGTKEFHLDYNNKFRKQLSRRIQLKAKCKLKLKKLKCALVNSLINMATAESVLLNSNNVQLLSFRYYQSFRGSPKQNCDLTFTTPMHSISSFSRDPAERKNTCIEKRDSKHCIQSKYVDDSLNTESRGITQDSSHSGNDIVFPVQYSYNTSMDPVLDGKAPTLRLRCDACKRRLCLNVNRSDSDTYSKCVPNVSRTTCNTRCSHPIPVIPHLSAPLSETCEAKKGHSSNSTASKRLPGWLRMLCEPMFIVISFTMSIQTFVVVCVVTTIEDYAKDLGIAESKGHYSLMALSTANLLGTLTLGVITDREFISRHRFISLCFFGMALSLIALTMVAVSLASLLTVLVAYGLLESGVIITFPVLTKEFVLGEKKQAVAIASSNVLSAPTVMLVPILIGHYRDHIGCYSGLFHLLAATSFLCSFIWLVAPLISKRKDLCKNIGPLISTVENKHEN